MPTAATLQAFDHLRDLSTIKWYVIPLFSIVLYIYTVEIKNARQSGNWNAVFAGLTLFAMDFINETWNGWVYHFTNYSAVWTVPGETGLRTMLGWNIEIMFMFALAGIVYYHTLTENRRLKILGIPEGWFWAIAYSAFAVFVECLLNIGNHLIWSYEYWNLSFKGIWLIFFFGYFHFYVVTYLVIAMKSNRAKVLTITALFAVAIIANIVTLGFLGWQY